MDYLEKNLSEQGREPTTNSTLIWCQHRHLNLGHMMITHDANSPQVLLTSECSVTTPSFCFPEQGREKEAQPESRQSFGVTATQTCGLVNLALSRQSFFFLCASICLL